MFEEPGARLIFFPPLALESLGRGSTFEPLLPASAPTGVLLIIRRLLARGFLFGSFNGQFCARVCVCPSQAGFTGYFVGDVIVCRLSEADGDPVRCV